MSAAGEENEYEEQHVHRVYEQIASHFSSTRYKVGLAQAKSWDLGGHADISSPIALAYR